MRHTSLFVAVLVVPLLSACGGSTNGPTDAELIAAAGNEYLEFVADQDPYLRFHPRAR